MLLDVGCGYNKFSVQRGDIHVDIQKPEISIRDFVLCDAHHLPFRRQIFDGCFFMDIVEHVDSPKGCLQEIAMVLKKHGWVELSTPNPLHWRNIFSALRGKEPHDDNREHIATWLSCNLIALLRFSGFQVVQVSYSNISVTHHAVLDRLAFLLLPRVVGGHHLLAKAFIDRD